MRQIFRLSLSCFCAALWSTATFAQISNSGEGAVNDWFDFLAQVNRYSPLEGAYSHGSSGLVVGAGGSRTEILEGAEIAKNELDAGTLDERSSLDVPRFWAVKGLPWPIDVGISGASTTEGELSIAAGHLQWSFYEELAMPALAVRASHSRIFGLQDTTFDSTGLDLVASYGFLRYFTAYGALGTHRNRAAVTIKEESDYAFMLRDSVTESTVEKTWFSQTHLYG